MLGDLLALGISDLNVARDGTTVRCILGAIALAKGALKLGAWIAYSDDSEIDEALENHHEWSDLYR